MEISEICFNNVSFAYDTESIFSQVSFSIARGESATIIGPNGGGKSTLVKLLLGQLQPNSGTILVGGELPQKGRKYVGYMPQYSSFDDIFPITVEEVVLMGLLTPKMLGWYNKYQKKLALEALERMGMANYAKNRFSSLSGGQRQRVLIARALVSDPRILILDEPTNNVDPVVEQELYEMLRALQCNMTVVTVSHDLGFVAENVGKVICVNKGVHVHGVSELNSEIIEQVYGKSCNMVRHDHCIGGHKSECANHNH